MRILLVEDHALFRDAVSRYLEQFSDDVTFVDAGNGSEARSACSYYSDLDLIIVDLSLPDVDGLELLPEFRRQVGTVPIVVVSASDDPKKVRAALEAGAVGYIPKKSSGPELLAALKSVLSGETYIPTALLSEMQDVPPPQSIPQVLLLMREGMPNKLIARELNLSEGTIKLHVSAIIHALGARNRTEAVTEADRRGLFVRDPK